MNWFTNFFILREVFYKPLFNALIWLYNTVALQDLGLAIIILTILVRVVLYPLFHQAAKHQRITQQLQPELVKIKAQHKNNREAQTRATLELFQKHKINPLTPLLLLTAQTPVILALYLIFRSNLTEGLGIWLYSFIPRPDELHQTFLGLINLREPSLSLAVFAAAAQYLQGKMSFTGSANPSLKVMIYIFPAVALVVLLNFPAAIGLYWLTTTLFSIIQQAAVNRQLPAK